MLVLAMEFSRGSANGARRFVRCSSQRPARRAA